MREYQADVLVVGAGGAGLRAAVAAREEGADQVIVVDKGVAGRSGCTQNSASDWMAFGAAFGHADPADSPQEHWYDIMIKGGLLCQPELARQIAYDAPARLLDLESYGAQFDKKHGKFIQILSDGARFPRACGKGTSTGPEVVRVLLRRAKELGVLFVDGCMVVDLITHGAPGRVLGCWGLDLGSEELVAFQSPSVVVATGGAGELYALNVFPEGMTGDGVTMAFRAGARLVNMEFIQIGPCIVHPVKFALSGVFWRLNPRLTNAAGEEFLPRYIPAHVDINKALYMKGVSFPFTVRNESRYVDIAVYSEIAAGRGAAHGGVYLDISHNGSEAIEQRARVPLEHLLERGIDIRREPVEFAPAIQHFNGGIVIDSRARADIAGLFAAGEAAGGQHGADRPGGNALADCQVYGAIAGTEAARYAGTSGGSEIQPWKGYLAAAEATAAEARSRVRPNQKGELEEAMDALRWAMWRGASVVRTAAGLEETQRQMEGLRDRIGRLSTSRLRHYFEARNLLDIGAAVLRAALARTESRGTHYRADFPQRRDDQWRKQILLAHADPRPQIAFRPVAVPEELARLLQEGKLTMD